ncbi:inner membrane protein [Bordetella ansorpii]|uniref:Inner membrane protein n=1 Tax=Bordetella ansorpii TaxID=288768 RepID=A0A157S672_9BORD|nr:DUF6776 family protein [Bordetella ansorpii]SAI65879.1 inner membrane protein [Bordetella ansorpii]
MAFGRSQRAVFKPSVYQPGKRSRRLPRWLVLLLVGIGLGAGGVLFLQTNYGPQRLTAEQSEQLHAELSASNLERQRLQAQLDETRAQRDANQTAQQQQTADLAQARERVQALTQEIAMFLDAIPPDPRGGDIGVRWGEFRQQQPGQLAYQALIMREKEGGQTFQGNITLEVSGNYKNGRRDAVTSEPIAIKLDRYTHAQGSMTLPDGFTARMVTIRVVDPQSRQQAMRIYYVRG